MAVISVLNKLLLENKKTVNEALRQAIKLQAHIPSSQISENECQDIVGEPAFTQVKERDYQWPIC
jgi:hypothetical protein